MSVTPATRLVASLANAMNAPSALMTGFWERWLPAVVGEPGTWLTSVVVPVRRS